MTCMNYRLHEVWCDHRDRSRSRWRSKDGCSGDGCDSCIAAIRTDSATIDAAPIDCDGIPTDINQWTLADVVGNLLRHP